MKWLLTLAGWFIGMGLAMHYSEPVFMYIGVGCGLIGTCLYHVIAPED
jgi:hypothetical protein